MILLIDNYDSFTYNLAHLFGVLGADVVVRRNDSPDLERLRPSRLVVSPGPGRPPQPVVALLRETRIPTLGVCLGHQAIVEAFGGEIGAARELVHGKACTVRHDGRGEGQVRRHRQQRPADPQQAELTARRDTP